MRADSMNSIENFWAAEPKLEMHTVSRMVGHTSGSGARSEYGESSIPILDDWHYWAISMVAVDLNAHDVNLALRKAYRELRNLQRSPNWAHFTREQARSNLLKTQIRPAFTHIQTGATWDIEAGEIVYHRATESLLIESPDIINTPAEVTPSV